MKEPFYEEMLDVLLKHTLSEESLRLEKDLAEAETAEARQPTRFSPEHEAKMKAIFKELRRQKPFYQRRWVQIAAACVALFICLVALSPPVSAAKNPIVRFFAVMREKSTSILTPEQERQREEGAGIIPQDIPGLARLGYVPEGYTASDFQEMDGIYRTIYKKDAASLFIFGQFAEDSSLDIDSENCEVKEILLENNRYLFSRKEGQCIVAWVSEGYKYCLTFLGNNEETEIKEILKNISYS